MNITPDPVTICSDCGARIICAPCLDGRIIVMPEEHIVLADQTATHAAVAAWARMVWPA